jgi:hypothetical protein
MAACDWSAPLPLCCVHRFTLSPDSKYVSPGNRFLHGAGSGAEHAEPSALRYNHCGWGRRRILELGKGFAHRAGAH